VVAKATGNREAKDYRKRGFQGAGEADASDEAGAPEALAGSELAPGRGNRGSGAVVLSGASDAGGGSELSDPDEGKGTSLFGVPGLAAPLPVVRAPCASGFFLAFCATGIAG